MRTSFLLGALAPVFLTLAASAAPITASSAISAVTVYTDRAVVTRSTQVELTAAGPAEVVFENLPAALVDQSLQVSGRGAATTILDVGTRATYVDFIPNERVQALDTELRGFKQQRRGLDDRLAGLRAQEASLDRIEAAATAAPTKESAPRMTIDESAKLLAFLSEQRSRIASERQSLDVQLEELTAKQTAVERQLNELRGAGGRSYKTVHVRLDVATPGTLALDLTYAVPGASWTPSYDVRVSAAEHAVTLGYFGLVRQNTGEDWKNVALTLSTARPSLGGQPPALAAWTVDVAKPVYVPQQKAEGDAAMHFKRSLSLSNFAAPAGQTAVATGGSLSLDVPAVATLAQAQLDSHLTSASFKIATRSTIASDNTPQKVPVTTTQLDAAMEYLTVPKQLAAAFLTAKVTNGSEFPLLAGSMNVFLDGTFVATSSLRTVMPGEKFDLALGVDDGIAIKRKLNNRFTEDTGLVNKGQRITYDATLTIQNNKKSEEKIVVVDQVPVSRNEKIVVKQLAPDEKTLKPEADGTLRWTLTLKPGEKRELPVKFTVEHENTVTVAGLD